MHIYLKRFAAPSDGRCNRCRRQRPFGQTARYWYQRRLHEGTWRDFSTGNIGFLVNGHLNAYGCGMSIGL
ncbi:MAG: hypothetical protein PVG73_03520, partial [Desulfobacterales bacterium]